MWERIPSIRCINLRNRPDRRQEATAVFEKLNIPVEFLPPIDIPMAEFRDVLNHI